MPVSFLTAHHIASEAHIERGERVVVTAAAGGVGTALLQILRERRARVLALAGSDAKLELCRTLGAEDASSFALRRRSSHLPLRVCGRARALRPSPRAPERAPAAREGSAEAPSRRRPPPRSRRPSRPSRCGLPKRCGGPSRTKRALPRPPRDRLPPEAETRSSP